MIGDCPSVIRDIQRRKFTHTVCGYSKLKQIVCCPDAVRPTPTTTNTPIVNRIDQRKSVQSEYTQNCSLLKTIFNVVIYHFKNATTTKRPSTRNCSCRRSSDCRRSTNWSRIVRWTRRRLSWAALKRDPGNFRTW